MYKQTMRFNHPFKVHSRRFQNLFIVLLLRASFSCSETFKKIIEATK
jgi:hypothetical protein